MAQTPQWMDFGEIGILLALEANQPDPARAKSANEILAMRRAGEAWPAIARALGCKTVDAILGTPPRAHGGARSSTLTKPRARGRRRHVA